MSSNISKIIIASMLTVPLLAGEVQYGKGTFEITGGFVGITQSIDTDISTYSWIEQHKNIPYIDLDLFYKYNITWYDSDAMVQAQNTVNKYADKLSQNPVGITVPSIDHRLQGLDINLVLGEDLYREDENNYFGLGLMIGVSTPWIDSKKDDDNNDALSDAAMNAMSKSKTKILSYKVGPSITAMESLGDLFSIYASGTYAYQTASLKNDYAHSDISANGIFQEYDIGIKFQPISKDYDLGWMTLSPRLYATLGYRYTSWDLDDVSMNVMGVGGSFDQMDFGMNSKVAYFGFGYSF